MCDKKLDIYTLLTVACLLDGKFNVRPVSYTHLDVYKRQYKT